MRKCLKQGVPHTMALPFTLKKYGKAKEELWKFKYFTMQKFNLKKKLYKRPKIFKKKNSKRKQTNHNSKIS
jgi:hypothetical protein